MAFPAFAETATLTYSAEGYANAEDVTDTNIKDAAGVVVAVATAAQGSNTQNPPKYYTTGTGLRLYANNTLTIAMQGSRTISKAVFTFSASNYAFKTGLSVSTGTFAGLGSATQTWTATEEVSSFTVTANATVRLQKIEITYTEAGSALLPAGLSFENDSYTANLGESFAAPVLSKDTDAAATYVSSNEEVATVDAATGAVTLLTAGTTVITASTEATDEYMAGSASYTLNVKDPDALDVTFDFLTEDYGLDRGQDYAPDGTTIENAPVKILLTKISGNGFRLWSDGLRVYKGEVEMTFTAPGYVITKIEFTNAKSLPFTFNVGTSTADSDNKAITWTGEADEVIANCNQNAGNNPIASITVYFKPSGAPSKENVTLAFPESSYTVLSTDTFEAPELTATNAAGEAVTGLVYTYTSSNPDVATVDAATGAVTIVGAGSTNIKVVSAENDTYNSSNTFYVLNVEKAANSIAEIYAAGTGVVCYVNFPMTVTYVKDRNIYVTAGGEFSLIYDTEAADTKFVAGDVIPAGWKAKYSPYNQLPEIAPAEKLPAASENVGYSYPGVSEVNLDMVNQVVYLQDVTFANETAATKASFTGTVNGTQYTFYNNFTIAAVEAGTYDVLVAVNNFKGALQLYVLEYKEIPANLPEVELTSVNSDVEGRLIVTLTAPAGSPEETEIWYKVTEPATEEQTMERAQTNANGYTLYTAPFEVVKGSEVEYYSSVNGRTSDPKTEVVEQATTGVENIEVEAAQAEYYNLQGVRVTNPAAGIFIRVLNGKATKVAL